MHENNDSGNWYDNIHHYGMFEIILRVEKLR